MALLEVSGEMSKPDIKVLGNSLFSQVHIHEKYGGVYPNLAKREHEKNLPSLLEKTLKEAGDDLDNPNIDFIAVTYGPGLEPALWVGIKFAEELGVKWKKPVLPINHMEGHVWSVLFEAEKSLELPALALLISGGHTELVHIKDFTNYEILGRTRDDAVGEAFDKAARMLGLPYPGGPQINRLAENSRKRNGAGRESPDAVSEQTVPFRFPRPMIHSKDLDFSYSGLKTAMLYKLREADNKTEEFKEDMACAFEDAAVEVLVEKTRRAIEKLPDVKTLIVAGGVAASPYVRQEIGKLVESYPNLELRFPTRELATDNAIMIGLAGFIRASKDSNALEPHGEIRAKGNLPISALQS